MKKLIEQKLEKYKKVLSENQLLALAYDLEEMYRTGFLAKIDKIIENMEETE